ncbi:phosphoenolpyruvate--protein phosphotransferase [Rhizobium sp. TRM95111]|uniref:putative PEP-binding protein n=1 Tax=Rhizobium alarense TaxID=2846851 RepID=UPI001EEB7FD1|nr:putative PEP-binding protein [Rhizobium alarense]MCF3640837.1 phosphoenolpyruvate--protein phosphotransferase [Rhizobium alarense]
MPEVLRLQGRGASPGRAAGPAHLARDLPLGVERGTRRHGDPDELIRAIRTVVAKLQGLAEQSDADSAAILDFQIELLLDPTMEKAVRPLLEEGADTETAWAGAVGDLMHGFEQAEDEHLRARAADFADVRDQVLRALRGLSAPDFPAGSVFVGRDIAPSLFLAHDWSEGGGIVLAKGSPASHVAMLARSRAVPMVVATGPAAIRDGMPVVLDGGDGSVVAGLAGVGVARAVSRPTPAPAPDPVSHARQAADGTPFTVRATINHPDDLVRIDPAAVDGVGLFRTEFLIRSPSDFDDEERQYLLYRSALDRAGDAEVTIRLFDFGGDKPLPDGCEAAGSSLGLRGLRLLLARPELLAPQLRALLRAAVHPGLRVMAPFVTAPEEMRRLRACVADAAARLAGEGIAHRIPEIGMMVEVPAAALLLDGFDAADFFSFGTNDLAQHLAAAARDDAEVADLVLEAMPAVLRLVRLAVDLAAPLQRPVAVCGELAGDPDALPALFAAGLRDFSVPPPAAAATRRVLAEQRHVGASLTGGGDGA